MRLVDAFTGHPLQTFAGHLNNKGLPIDGCFSPDSKYVFAGSTDGRVHVWDTDTGFKVGFISYKVEKICFDFKIRI